MRIHPTVIDMVKCLGPGRFVFVERERILWPEERYIFRWVPEGKPREFNSDCSHIAIRPDVFWGTS